MVDERSMPDDFKIYVTSIHYITSRIGGKNDKQSDLLA
jgi:hypothetical protein